MLAQILLTFRTISLWIVTGIITIFYSLLIYIWTLLFGWIDKNRTIPHLLGRCWGLSLFGANPFWRLQIEGLEHVDPKQRYVIVCNHSSMTDILVLYHLPLQFKWMAKEELFKVPILGWTMTCMKYIRLKRGNFASIRKSYDDAKAWIAKGICVVIFPEGTRSRDGKIQAFKNGAFRLAIETKTPILPVALSGMKDMLPKGSGSMSWQSRGKMTILKPCSTENFDLSQTEGLRLQVHADIEKLLR